MTASVVWVETPTDTADRTRAAELGLARVSAVPATGFYLRRGVGGLALHHTDAPPGDAGIRAELLDARIARRASGGRRTPLARALGLRRRPRARVLDATCGLGRDSATLAALGCTVHAIERHPVPFALVADAHRRAMSAETPPAWLAHWPVLRHADAGDWIAAHAGQFYDAVYLDPMFDAPRRKARPQKTLAWLGALLGIDDDAQDVLAAARRAFVRIVVKQHARAAPLAPPDLQIRGKAVRYDVYFGPAASVDERSDLR